MNELSTHNQLDGVCPLAVVGMAFRLPCAPSEEEFWRLLMEGRVNYTELSEERLKKAIYYDPQKGIVGKTYSKVGAAYDFRLLEKELRAINNNFHIEDRGFLLAQSVALEACRNAGYSAKNFPHKNAGVFMGFTKGSRLGRDWTFAQNVEQVVRYLSEIDIIAKLPPQKRSGYIERIVTSLQTEYAKATSVDPNKSASILAARNIAETLKLEGQAMIMDAACSSSLSALSIAARSLAMGEIDAAIVGGASYFSFDSLILFSKAQSVSGTMSRPFDTNADGLVCGEGHVFFVIKTLKKALEDGDHIRAVIRGIGVSSDGRGKSLWAPRKEGQMEAIRRAYRQGGDPQRLRFVEGHMTSTPLGDPTEISAINEVFREILPRDKKILIGGVKANVGHTLEAAGLIGLAKAVLVLEHKIVPGQINIEQLNEQVDWANVAVKVPVETTPLTPLQDGSPIQAAVNSFGIGGLNMHVVLEEWNEVGNKQPSASDGRLQKPSPVAVIGMGCLFPGANGVESYWNLLHSGSDPKTECPASAWDKLFFRSEHDSQSRFMGGYITNWEYDWKKHKIPPKQIVQANPLQFMILDTVDQALKNAGYTDKEFDRRRTSVVVGMAFDSGDFAIALQMGLQLPEIVDVIKKTLEEGGMEGRDIEKAVIDYQKLVFRRYPALLDETGSFTASTLASRITKSFDLMGGAVTVDSGNVSSMAALNTALDMIRTGESSMVVCVGAQRSTSIAHYLFTKNKCRATNNLDPLDVHADGYYPGEGVGVVLLKSLEQAKTDGDRIHAIIHDIACSAGQDTVDVSEQSLQASLQHSALSGADVALLETSCGISLEHRDRALSSWGQTFSSKSRGGSESPFPALGSVFAQIGHLAGASGMASLIKAILALHHQESPAIFGTNEIPKSKFCRTSKKLEPHDEAGRLFSIVLNADAVEDKYGISYSVLLERGTRVERAISQPKKHAMLSMTSPRLRAFMFAGQGSQYKEMLRPLAEASEDCREIIANLGAKLRQFGYPTLADAAWDESVELGRDPFPTQLSLLIADTVFSELLKRFRCSADLILGHSYGEYPALVASGAWDFETAAMVTHARCGIINEVTAGTTGMLSTDASIDQLQKIFPTISTGRLYISNFNSQKQVVVSGDNDALRDLDLILKQKKHLSLILPVPAGFHSPLVEAVREPLKKVLEQVPIRFPAIPFLSSVSGRFEAEPEAIRENLVEQMVRPVDFVAMLQKAYKYGVRQFVEVGPKTVLTNLAKTIFAEHDDVEFIHCDLLKKTGQEALEHFQKAADALAIKQNRNLNRDRKVAQPQPQPSSSDGDSDHVAHSKDLLEGLTFVEFSGSPYQIGYENGKQFQREIRGILHRYADAAGQHRLPLPNVASVLDDAGRFFDEDTLQELQGLSAGAGVPLRSLLRHNLSAYPPTSAGPEVARAGQACVYFAGNVQTGGFVVGANVDVPLYRMLPGSHLEILQLRRPEGKLPHLLASGVGFLGGVFGINASGLCVTTASLSEFPWDYSNSSGTLPLHILGRILAEAKNIEETVELLKTTRTMGAWSFGISELSTGKIAHIEYCNDSMSMREDVPYVIAANHQLTAGFQIDGQVPPCPVHSVSRYEQLKTLLNPSGDSFTCSTESAFNVLRDKTDPVLGRIPRHRTLNTLWRIDNIISFLVDANEGTLKLATTDITRTDALDDPKRHLTLPLVQLLPELDAVFTAAKKQSSFAENTVPVAVDKISAVISREEYIERNTSKDGKNPNPSPTLFERHALRLIETPVPSAAASTIHGAAIIVCDDRNQVADALKNRLDKTGMKVFTFPIEQEPENIKNVLENIWNAAPVSHLVFLTPHDPSAAMNDDYLTHRYTQSSVAPLVILREWVPLALSHFGNLESCRVLGATSLGGDFGIADAPFAVESGAISGLLKGLQREFSRTTNPVRVKVIDHSRGDSPERIAGDLFREMNHWDNDVEVGYANGRRFVLRSIPLPLESKMSVKSLSSAKPVWLITGGARGITAAVASALGKRFHAKLHLVGSSPLPTIDDRWATFSPEELKDLRKQVFQEAVARKEVPVKAWEKVEKAIEIVRNLRGLQSEGIDFTYHSCDITDSVAVRSLLQKIAAEDGRITGIIHGAGFEAACRLEKKKIENIRRTMDVKVKGAITLLRELEAMKTEPEYFIGFSSVSGRFGGVGQTDYSMANEMLAKLLDWYAANHPRCRSACFHWPAWGEIGMAVRPESKIALEAAGLNFMPPSEGIQHLLDEVEFGGGEREILIVDWKYYKRFYPDDVSVPPIVEQKVATPRRFIIHGNNADAAALLESVPPHATQGKETLIVTTPRDPLSANILGVNHWKARVSTSLRATLDHCKNWLSTNPDGKELILLTATDPARFTFFPEGVIVADVLRTWVEEMNEGTTSNTLPTIRVLDFAADAPPKMVATETLHALEVPNVPGTFTMSRWEEQWKTINVDDLDNVPICDINEIDTIRASEKKPGEWMIAVPHANSYREVECIDDQLKTFVNETHRLGIKVHVCADSTFDLSGMKDADCMVYQRTDDTEETWAEMLQSIRANASALTGVVVIESERHEELLESIETATTTAVTLASLTRKDALQFMAVLPWTHDSVARSTAALLTAMPFQSKSTKIFVIRDKERKPLVLPRKSAQTATLLLLDSIEKTENNSFTTRGQFHPVSDTFLLDHQLNGNPILPMVVTLECFLEAVRLEKGALHLNEISVEDLKIHQGFRFKVKKSFDYYIVGNNESADENAVSLTLLGDYYNAQGHRIKTDKEYSTTLLRFDDQQKRADLNFVPVSDDWHDTWYADDLPIYHGPSFRCLKQIHYMSENQAITAVDVPCPTDLFAGRKALTEPFIHAAVLDAALFSCGILHWKTMRQDICLPSKIRKTAFGPGRLREGETVYIHIEKVVSDQAERKSGVDDKHAEFNFTIRNPDGDAVYDITGYMATVLKAPQQIPDNRLLVVGGIEK